MASRPIFLLYWANIIVSSSIILLQSGSRLSQSRNHLTSSSSSVSSLELRLSLLGVAGLLGFLVPFCVGLVGFVQVIPASLLVGGIVPPSFSTVVGGLVQASFTVGAGGIVLASFSVSAGGIIPAAFSVGVLVAFSGPSSARSNKALQCYSTPFPFPFPWLVGLAEGAFCSYRRMEVDGSCSYWRVGVVRISNGEHAVLIVRWYEVDWCDHGHPSQGTNHLAL